MGKGTVLVIDDKRSIRLLIRTALEMEGYQVVTASSGRDGIISAMEIQPNLVILDLLMPGGSGDEVVRELRSREESSKIPIIVITAHMESHEIQKMPGIQDHLVKPFDIDELVAKVADWTSGVMVTAD